MRRLGTWLGVTAIVLQLAWPLLAGALPRQLALVPLCTVDGVTHYLEVPTGKTPLENAGHGNHCPLCCLGGTALAGQPPAFALPAPSPASQLSYEAEFFQQSSPGVRWARAPPFLPVVTSNDHALGRSDEDALLAGRDARRAHYRGRFVWLGLLHDQH